MWNWQLPEWPSFFFDCQHLKEREETFLSSAKITLSLLEQSAESERQEFLVQVLSLEGEKSSQIEGELLDRESLQSSIKKHFGLHTGVLPKHAKEEAMASLICSVYQTFASPLTHEMLWQWHRELFAKQPLDAIGTYREHKEPMQIVSHRMDVSKVFFEAPPSDRILSEMKRFLDWFNSSSQSILTKAALAHLYFENIHPFEDGNGRIGRALIEKSLSQSLGRPTVIAISKVLEKRKKQYYQALESCNRTLNATTWVDFFSEAALQAQKEALVLLEFLLAKSRLFSQLSNRINPRQEKALLRMFAEGPKGFDGGMSAEKYIAITSCSRSTATRDLQELVTMGALSKTGELRHTRYWLNLKTGDKKPL